MLKKEMHVEMRSMTLLHTIATMPNSVRPKMANMEMNVEMEMNVDMRSLTSSGSIGIIPNFLRPKMSNKGNEC